MEESKDISKSFAEINDMYLKIKVEIKCQFEKGDKCEHLYYEPVLQAIENKLKSEEKGSSAYLKLILMKTSLLYEHAKIVAALRDSNENSSLQLLKEALNLIQDYKNDPDVVYLQFRITNIFAFTLSKMGQFEEALKIVEEAENLYESIKNKTKVVVFSTDDLFQNDYMYKGDNTFKFEKLITNNFQIQAWIYNKMNMSKKFLKYHHIVLNRQLQTQDGNAMVWFYKCARLGVHFISNHKFVEGKHHLAAAHSVLREYELELLKHRSEPHFFAEYSNLQKYYADLGKYWAKYGLFLLNASSHLAVNHANCEQNRNINDILIQTFQDLAPARGLAREWFNIKKNSLYFDLSERVTNETLTDDSQKDTDCRKNLTEEFSDENQSLASKEFAVNDLVKTMQEEITKLNSEVANEAEEITDMTKSIIDELDDRQKKVEENEEKANGDHESEQTDSKFEEETNQTVGDQNDKTQEEIKEEAVVQNESFESLKNSKETNKKDSQTSNYSDAQSTSSKTEDEIDYEFKFTSLDLTAFEKIPTALIDNTDSAREFFLFIQQWIKRSKNFYTMHDHPNEHIQLILDLNELYRYLSAYETDLESQYNLQHRRVEILEALSSMMKEIHPQEYLFISIELLQELMQAQIDLLILNIRRLTHVRSSGSLLLKDICQEHNDAMRKMEALVEIQRRLGRKDTRLSLVDMQLFG